MTLPVFRPMETAAFWNGLAASYDEQFDHMVRSPAERLAWDRVLDVVDGSVCGLTVLDLGTGTGFLALELAARGHHVVGLDLAPQMLGLARRNAGTRHPSVAFVLGDASEPPFAAESVDMVVSRHLLWCMPDQARAIKQWLRLLRPGGSLAVFDGDWSDVDSGRERSLATSVAKLIEDAGGRGVVIDDMNDLYVALEARRRTVADARMFPRFLVCAEKPKGSSGTGVSIAS